MLQVLEWPKVDQKATPLFGDTHYKCILLAEDRMMSNECWYSQKQGRSVLFGLHDSIVWFKDLHALWLRLASHKKAQGEVKGTTLWIHAVC